MRFFNLFALVILIAITSVKIANAQSNKNVAKLAVVDVESILENSLAIANIKNSINALGELIQEELTEKEKEFKKREQELIELQKTLPKEKFDFLVNSFNQNINQAQKNFKVKKLALEQSHSRAIEKVQKTIIAIIGELAKKYDFNTVLPSTHVLFIKDELNITSEVLSTLNARLVEVPIEYEKLLK